MSIAVAALFVVVLVADVVAAALTREVPRPEDRTLLLQLSATSLAVAVVLVVGFCVSARAAVRNGSDPDASFGSVQRIPDLLIMVLVAAFALAVVSFCDNPVSNAGIALGPIVVVILLGDRPREFGRKFFFRKVLQKHSNRGGRM